MTTSRTSDSLSRRTALAGISATGFGLALAATTHHAAAQDATPTSMAGHPLVGTWIVDRNPGDSTDAVTAVVYTADSGWIDPLVGAAGTWQATGPHSAAWTAIGLVDEGAGGYFALRTSAEIDDAGMNFAGTASVTIVAPDGTVVTTISGGPMSHGVRLQVEPVEAGGTALTGVPTWTPATPTPSSPTP
jgi:hypothetical protein